MWPFLRAHLNYLLPTSEKLIAWSCLSLFIGTKLCCLVLRPYCILLWSTKGQGENEITALDTLEHNSVATSQASQNRFANVASRPSQNMLANAQCGCIMSLDKNFKVSKLFFNLWLHILAARLHAKKAHTIAKEEEATRPSIRKQKM